MPDTEKIERINYLQISQEIIKEFQRIITPLGSSVPYIYRCGYYDKVNSVQILKARITARLNSSATKSVVDNTVDFIYRSTTVDRECIEKSNLVCLNNCLLNLDTMETEKFHPSKMVFYKLPLTYNENADTESIYHYVKEISPPSHHDKLQEHCGNIFASHCLTKKLAYFVGKQNSGKSTFLEILRMNVGIDNCSTLNLNELGEKFTNADIVDKRVNICSDIPYKLPIKYYNRVKNFTGGDAINIQKKHCDSFTYLPIAKMFFSGNGIPTVNFDEGDDAFFSRWDFIDFPYTFSKKSDILSKYTTPEIGSAFLNWMIEGYQRLKQNNWELTNGDNVDSAKERFLNIQCDFNDWLVENYEPDIDSSIPKEDLFRDCMIWHRARETTNHPYVTEYPVFCKRMLDNKKILVHEFFPVIEDKQQKHFKGIKKKCGVCE